MANQYLPKDPNIGISYNPYSLKTIYLAGGCFWGTQAYIKRLLGVAKTTCGYANGRTQNPTYQQVCTGTTGFAEAVRVDFDPAVISLRILLAEYFKTIDPTSYHRQGGDVGSQYRTGIYYADPIDLPTIERTMANVADEYTQPVVVETEPIHCFYPAEDYHQNYLDKNPGGYCHVDLDLLPRY